MYRAQIILGHPIQFLTWLSVTTQASPLCFPRAGLVGRSTSTLRCRGAVVRPLTSEIIGIVVFPRSLHRCRCCCCCRGAISGATTASLGLPTYRCRSKSISCLVYFISKEVFSASKTRAHGLSRLSTLKGQHTDETRGQNFETRHRKTGKVPINSSRLFPRENPPGIRGDVSRLY